LLPRAFVQKPIFSGEKGQNTKRMVVSQEGGLGNHAHKKAGRITFGGLRNPMKRSPLQVGARQRTQNSLKMMGLEEGDEKGQQSIRGSGERIVPTMNCTRPIKECCEPRGKDSWRNGNRDAPLESSLDVYSQRRKGGGGILSS